MGRYRYLLKFAAAAWSVTMAGCSSFGAGALPAGGAASASARAMVPTRYKIHEFADLLQGTSASYVPFSIAGGPAGLLWVTDSIDGDFGESAIVSIATDGSRKHAYYYPGTSSGAGFVDITAGPDGALWSTDDNNLQLIRLSTNGHYTAFPLDNGSDPVDITTGPDKALWFTASVFKGGSAVERMTTKGRVTEYTLPVANLLDITAGPDGALWFTEPYAPAIGRITTHGKITQYSEGITGAPVSIAAGPDGALWFTEQSQNGGKIGRITTAGSVTEYSNAVTQPNGIAAGPDGAMWFTENASYRSGAQIGRISMQGRINEYSRGFGSQSQPADIAAGPDGRMWFVDSSLNETGRVRL